jgi:glycosyltransferase involved in cell wall biosynthesis
MVPVNEIQLGAGDVLHITSVFEPVPIARVWPQGARTGQIRLAVTLYDLIPHIYPEHYLADSAYRRRYENRLQLVRQADRVLAISDATRSDAIERLGLDPTCVVSVGTGVSTRFHKPESRELAFQTVQAANPGIRRDYILYAGAVDHRKNVGVLLEAYAGLPEALRRRHQLLIVSRLARAELDALRPRLRTLGISRDVRLASAVDDDDLVPIYQAAALFVFPSLYEGFGLPAAEAIACGAPTIASRSSSLVEVVRFEEALFDPRDATDLRAHIERVLTDNALRGRLAAAELDERHTWPNVATRVLDVYGELRVEPVRPVTRHRRRALEAIASEEENTWNLVGAGTAPAQRPAVRRLVRGALWPVRRFFDPRFAGVDSHVTMAHADLSSRMDRAFGAGGEGSLVRMEASLRSTRTALEQLSEEVTRNAVAARAEQQRLEAAIGELQAGTADLRAGSPAARLTALTGVPASQLDGDTARFLTTAVGHEGFAAQAGLWFNAPVAIAYRKGGPFILGVNERVVEIPYVFASLATLPVPSRVLDVGARESTVALSLASLGHLVTALDPRGYSLTHPNLREAATTLEAFTDEERYDAVVCLSTIEHLGLEVYDQAAGDADADLAASRHIHDLLRPGGLLVLTTPTGPTADATSHSRIYDAARLQALLAPFTVADRRTIVRHASGHWAPADDFAPESIALVTARRET